MLFLPGFSRPHINRNTVTERPTMSAILSISIDLAAPTLTDTEKAILAALNLTPGAALPTSPGRRAELMAEAAAEQGLSTQTEEADTEEKPAPQARAPRKPRAKKDDAPAASGPAALEDLPTATRSEAIEWAIKLSDKGLKDELRGILDTLGAERASTITDGEQAAQFIALTKSVLASQPAEKPAPEAEDAPVEETPAKAPAIPAPGRTLDDAVAAAMDLVKSGKAATVRSAVEALGVAKVSAMTEEQVPDFFSLIDQIEG